MTLIIIAALVLWSQLANPLIWLLIFIGVTLAITFSIRKWVLYFRQKKTNRFVLLLNLIINIAGILIAVFFAALLAGWGGGYLVQITGKAMATYPPRIGNLVAILISTISGLIVGYLVGMILRRIMDLLPLGYSSLNATSGTIKES